MFAVKFLFPTVTPVYRFFLTADIHFNPARASYSAVGDVLWIGIQSIILFIALQLCKNVPYKKTFEENYSRFFHSMKYVT